MLGLDRVSLIESNQYLWVHLSFIVFFGFIYRYCALLEYSGLTPKDRSDLSTLHSCIYHAAVTEFTVGALNNPESGVLRSLVVFQIILSFIFLNL